MCDKLELYTAAMELLGFMEHDLYCEDLSLAFNDAWETFEEYVTELGLELADE